MRVVDVEKVQANQASFVPELSRLRSAGAETVVLLVLTEAIGILRDAKAINYQPLFTGSLWCIDEFSTATPELFRGTKCLKPQAPIDSPVYPEYKAKAQEY